MGKGKGNVELHNVVINDMWKLMDPYGNFGCISYESEHMVGQQSCLIHIVQ